MTKTTLCAMLLAATAAAAPNRITYQGRLTQSGVPATGSRTFQACFGPGGTTPCAPAKNLTLPSSGDFTLVIDVPAGVDFLNGAVQLTISVDGNPLSPAEDFASVPYALVAGTAAVALTAQSVLASQVPLDGTGAFLSSWQSTTTASMIDAAKILGSLTGQWTAGGGGVLSYTGGNVGVGTTAPAGRLHVSGTVYPQLTIDNAASRTFALGVTGSTLRVRDVTGASDRVTLDSNGNVGVGTTSPRTALEVHRETLIVGNNGAGAEYNDWPTPSISIRRSDDFVTNGVGMMSFGYRNDPLSFTDDSVANVRLWDPAQAANAATSSASTQLRIASPGPLLLQPNAGNVGIGTDAPATRLEVNGEFIRTIQRNFGHGPNDEMDNGQVVTRVLNMTKRRADTGVRITYTDNFRVEGPGGRTCRWEVRFNGASCPPPSGPLIYDMHVPGSNIHYSATQTGTCFGLPAGPHQVQVWVGGVPNHVAGNCFTGWNEQYWSIEAEEVR